MVEKWGYGGEWGVKTPMQQRTTALQHELRQTTEKERRRLFQVVYLSVLAAASFRIAITLSLS